MSVNFATNNLKLLSSASVLPGSPLSNQDLFELLNRFCGQSAARKARLLARRLKIDFRHFCQDFSQTNSGQSPVANQTSIDLASEVITQLLEASRVPKKSVGYLIGHTTSPATLIPPNIAWVADRIGFENPYMELRQACTGFANALQIASPMLADPKIQTIAIVGSEAGSMYCDLSQEFLDQQQLVNFVQMGDGAGGVLLAADDNSGRNIISDIYFGHIGLNQKPAFQMEGGGSLQPFCQQGFPVFKHDVTGVKERGAALFTQGLNAVLNRGYELSQFDFILPHQVNGHLAELMGKQLGIASSKIIVDAEKLGNLGSAAIWVSLDRLIKNGRLAEGNKVLVLGAEATKYMYGGFVYTH